MGEKMNIGHLYFKIESLKRVAVCIISLHLVTTTSSFSSSFSFRRRRRRL
jgi:hypothetical protein